VRRPGLPRAFIALISALGCNPVAERDRRGLEVVVPTDTATLDPRYATRSLDIKISRLVHAGLVGLNADSLEPEPLLAARLERQGPMRLDVELKPGIRFHSGRPLQAADVCATLSAIADPALQSPHRAVVRAIGSCTPTSASRLTIRLSEPRATLLTDLELPILRAEQVRAPPSLTGALDGLGPYRIARTTPSETELAPASTGLLPRPAHPVVIRTVRDENARALRLLAGRSDVAPNAISEALLPALEKAGPLSVHSRRGANVTYLLMQNDRPPFHRRAVRHAVAQAIDRERIVRYLLASRAEPAVSIFPPGHWSNARPPRSQPYDPARARSVLRGLGAVTLLTSTERARITIARAMAQMLEDAGLTVRVVPLDLGVLLARLDAGDFDLASLQLPELTEPNLLKWFFHPSAVPGEGGEGRNRARYRNPRAAELLDHAARTSDLDERRRLYTELAELMAGDMPVVPLWHENQTAVVSERAQEFHLSAEGRWSALARVH
jgi:peptide/nickel transport system substrate-binding protein